MNIIINGGTRGIGKEVVSFMAQDISNHILVTGRDEKALNSLSAKFTNVKTFALDISLFDSTREKFIETISDNLGRVDRLINLAGHLIVKDFLDFTNNEARLIMETNFFGTASLIRALVPMMPEGSHIVNISSMGGFQSSSKYKGLSYYSASKAALACLTNCLALGAVQTEMLDEAFPGYKAPVNAVEMAEYISGFVLTGNKFFNGKILPVAIGNP